MSPTPEDREAIERLLSSSPMRRLPSVSRAAFVEKLLAEMGHAPVRVSFYPPGLLQRPKP